MSPSAFAQMTQLMKAAKSGTKVSFLHRKDVLGEAPRAGPGRGWAVLGSGGWGGSLGVWD